MLSNNDDNEEEFADASSEFKDSSILELTEGISLAHQALDLFLNNEFESAKKILEPKAGSQIYPSLGFTTVMFLQAMITMESQQIEDASNAAKVCLDICQKKRKKASLAESIKIKSKSTQLNEFANYSDEQCHAELCYAECLLEKACLTLVQDENLIALIKSSLKIRECYLTYKDCWKIIEMKKWNNEFIKINFESGVRLGYGFFNLIISMLPTRILKILEFVGFKGNQDFGLKEMNYAAGLNNTIRQPLASLFLLSYHCFAGVIVGMYPFTDHIDHAKRLIAPNLAKYSTSALFNMLQSRIDVMCGKFDEAVEGYENAIGRQNEWRNLHDICHWELLWCHVLECDWLLGMKYAEKLSQQSKWSKATYLYLKGAFLLECYSDTIETVTEEMKMHMKKIFESVPNLLQRFAGKSLPVEKFAAKKSKRFFEQSQSLVLPGVELVLVWNGFKMMGGNKPCLERFQVLIEKTLTKLNNQNPNDSKFYYDNLALVILLKAVCLRYLKKIPEAIELMNSVINYGKKIKEDLYLLPFTEVELAQIAFLENRYDDVRMHINNAKSYKGYSLESRLHFRIHGINMTLNKVSSIKRSISDDSISDVQYKDVASDLNHNEMVQVDIL